MNFNFGYLKKTFGVIALFGLGMISSCKDSLELPTNFRYGYFPVEVGRWWEYEVDSIYHDAPVLIHDTSQFILHETIESKFFDNQGRESNRIERIKLFKDSLNWTPPEIWTSTLTLNTVERYEENVRYLRLVYPMLLNKSWNGNEYNTMTPWRYKYVAIDKPYTVGNLHFDSTVTVLQIDFPTFIGWDYAFEVYAKNVGLIHKKHVEILFNINGDNDTTVTAGREYEYRIKAWGQ